jgi:hypothetical protein
VASNMYRAVLEVRPLPPETDLRRTFILGHALEWRDARHASARIGIRLHGRELLLPPQSELAQSLERALSGARWPGLCGALGEPSPWSLPPSLHIARDSGDGTCEGER